MTNKRKEMNAKNTTKQILNVMLIEDRINNLISPRTKIEKNILILQCISIRFFITRSNKLKLNDSNVFLSKNMLLKNPYHLN